MSERAPLVLLPYQQRWVADKSQVKVCEKSRRVGLSWAEAADDTLTASEAGGQDVWYIGYNKEMAQEFIRDCADWARQYQLAASAVEEEVLRDEDKDILTFVIKFASGHRITALSSRPSNLRGKQGIVVIDEAAFHDDLPGLIKAAMALLMWGGKVRIVSTHDGDQNPFNELILECRARKRPYSVHRIEFKAALAEGLYRRICLTTGQAWSQDAEAKWAADLYAFYGEDAAEELDVIPASGEGAFLTRAMIEACMREDIPVLRVSQPDEFAELRPHLREAEMRDWLTEHVATAMAGLDANLMHFVGSDFARSGDVSALWVVAERRDLGLHTPFVLEMRNIPFDQQRQALFYLLDRLPKLGGAALDARGNGQYLAEVTMQRYGATRVHQVMLTVDWYRSHMPRLRAHLEDRTLSVPRDADVLADLRSIKKERGIAKVPDNVRIRGTDGRERHGDTAIAAALAVYAVAEIAAAPIEYMGAPDRTSRWDGVAQRRDFDRPPSDERVHQPEGAW